MPYDADVDELMDKLIGLGDKSIRKNYYPELQRRMDELEQLNIELEQRVAERTAELAAANKELEAFCYSVSHDLRAPLRCIDGFSLAVLEDYGHLLDEEGQGYLQRVRLASQRMAELIDGLLNLSRLTRGEIVRQEVELSTIVRDVAEVLRQAQPEREVCVIIEPGLKAYGDNGMLRILFENLLGNAFKFTVNRTDARVEVGKTVEKESNRTIFYVRDNGAGFNMVYADKLFGAFQRLHTVHEFPGNGIGLATVQRIINRHGGEIWAQGEVGQGATFFFSLAKKM
ncbi:ATP-binding protein [Sporomusa sp. KB1]|jgi:light-regulated signal transduction histidine kinase (bacteriophytochrome)|uniref:sensor histidine kinase n=1 Tax=Sporomusa sp. KB1 TaxID=943346 RepID=UPI0011A28EF2|nr:ATP-binding protein [Sporomusa sp. KB1]TWH52137.1 Bacteriophytochrome (light-regulated signal transduction histidine kinase) [Sporomusa sp. KB1]